jgi:hypothetical protein
MKLVLVVTLVTLFIASVLTGYNSNDVFGQAQNNVTAPTTISPQTKWTEYFKNALEFPDKMYSTGDTIEVLYESANTVTIQSEYIDAVWRAVDYIKKDGYKIDDVVQYINYDDITIMVVLSK